MYRALYQAMGIYETGQGCTLASRNQTRGCKCSTECRSLWGHNQSAHKQTKEDFPEGRFRCSPAEPGLAGDRWDVDKARGEVTEHSANRWVCRELIYRPGCSVSPSTEPIHAVLEVFGVYEISQISSS